jgi:transglutaminase-like putative cysteine protease
VKVRIRWEARYDYSAAISFSPHIYRLFPRGSELLPEKNRHFQTNDDAVVRWRLDAFGNFVAHVFYPEPGNFLSATLDLELELRPQNAFDFLLDSHALQIPFRYTPQEQRALFPYLDPDRSFALPFWKMTEKSGGTIETLVSLNEAIYKNLEYRRREEGQARAASETLTAGEGSCRDFAVLMMESLRSLGLAARLASGYLCDFEGTGRAEGSLHAWTETYLPGAGWIGLDPTNGIFCNHHHITAAVGLEPADIAPVTGKFFGNSSVQSRMSSALAIEEIS